MFNIGSGNFGSDYRVTDERTLHESTLCGGGYATYHNDEFVATFAGVDQPLIMHGIELEVLPVHTRFSYQQKRMWISSLYSVCKDVTATNEEFGYGANLGAEQTQLEETPGRGTN